MLALTLGATGPVKSAKLSRPGSLRREALALLLQLLGKVLEGVSSQNPLTPQGSWASASPPCGPQQNVLAPRLLQPEILIFVTRPSSNSSPINVLGALGGRRGLRVLAWLSIRCSPTRRFRMSACLCTPSGRTEEFPDSPLGCDHWYCLDRKSDMTGRPLVLPN